MHHLRLPAVLLAIACTTLGIDRFVAAAGPQGPPDVPAWATRELRAGIIGTDTSHVPAFAKILRSHPEWRIRLVAAFKGGSPDLPLSADRVDGFARTIQEDFGVELVDSIAALIDRVDVVLLTSVDGNISSSAGKATLR